MNELNDENTELRSALLETIDQSARGMYVPMIKTLMGLFGYNANHRVRQSSLAEVTRTLADWGIGHQFSGGVSSIDYVRLFRMAPETITQRAQSSLPPAPNAEHTFDTSVSPFEFGFTIGDAIGSGSNTRSAAQIHDMFAAIWSARPVLLFVEAPDEFFSLCGGIAAAVMRRRNLMIRTSSHSFDGPTAASILSIERMKKLLGQTDSEHDAAGFPSPGAVYLIRDNADEGQDDELVAQMRELFVPQTYRVRARFASTAGDPAAGPRAMDDTLFSSVLQWLAVYGGSPRLAQSVETDRLMDLSSLFAEASQLRETLLERSTLETTDPEFRSGFESTEHMVIKNLVAKRLRARFPGDKLEIERSVSVTRQTRRDLDEEETDDENEDKTVRGKPDVRVIGRVGAEIETLRSVCVYGSNPFFALEQKLRRKLDVYQAEPQLWIVVPTDVALLAESQLNGLIKNLQQGQDKFTIRLATPDVPAAQLVFLNTREPPQSDARLIGASWREPKNSGALEKLTWDDVAGYSDIKGRLREDVLAPIRDPARYARHKLGSSNGVLLHGLPGCGKSLIGRVMAGEADLPCRRIVPSDMTSAWLGESTLKIREQFDWALKQSACLMVIDELDAIAPQRTEHNMHADEKRTVNELLAQLDRIQGKSIIIVGTTNYYRGIDSAVRRSGRFDTKLPVFPPTEDDRARIFDYYLGPKRLAEIDGVAEIDTSRLARLCPLFAPADIRVVVEMTARRAIARTSTDRRPRIDEPSLVETIRGHSRSIQRDDAVGWIEEAQCDLGTDDANLRWLRTEVERAYPA